MTAKASNVFKIIRQKNLNIDRYIAECPNVKVLHENVQARGRKTLEVIETEG